jgi:hypothetical protein
MIDALGRMLKKQMLFFHPFFSAQSGHFTEVFLAKFCMPFLFLCMTCPAPSDLLDSTILMGTTWSLYPS